MALGYHKTQFVEGVRHWTNKLFKGASVTTVVHETFHGLYRKALAAGTVSQAEALQFVRAVDAVYGDKMLKRGALNGERLSLLPAGITDEQVTPKMIDEALSEIAEADILMNRKRDAADKAIKLEGGIISRNLMALSKLAPGATRKFRLLIDSARGIFGLSSARALALKKAEREGRFDREGYDAFLNKITGYDASAVTEQAKSNSHDAEGVGDSAFALAPLGAGTRKITEAPKVVEITRDPFDGFSSNKKGDWLAKWKDWLTQNGSQWKQTIHLPEGPVMISSITVREAAAVKRKESLEHHFQAASMLPKLLKQSKLAIVEKPDERKPNVQEIHKRYAWATFPDGSRKNVLLTILRWKGDAIEKDTAYSVESIEVQERAADTHAGLEPAASTAPATMTGDGESLAHFLSGIKQEHRFDEYAPPSDSAEVSFSLGRDSSPSPVKLTPEQENQVEDRAFAEAKKTGEVNTDLVRPTIPGYDQADPHTREALFHPIASAINSKVLKRMLAEPPEKGRVLVLAGGGGSGKSTVMGDLKSKFDFVFDTTLSYPGSAKRQLEKIEQSGRKMTVLYVHRTFPKAFDNILKRYYDSREETGAGRIVPLKAAIEAHLGAQNEVLGLKGAEIIVVDNNKGLLEHREISLEELRKQRYYDPHEPAGTSSTTETGGRGRDNGTHRSSNAEEDPRAASSGETSSRAEAAARLEEEGRRILGQWQADGLLNDQEVSAFLAGLEEKPKLWLNLIPEHTPEGWQKHPQEIKSEKSDQTFDFVVTENGDLKIGKSHAYLSNKDDVRAAGQVVFRNGEVVRINNLSGHYKPFSVDSKIPESAFEASGFNAKERYRETLRRIEKNKNHE